MSGRQEESTAAFKRFMSTAKCLSLAVCYSATCGGMATITGTGTNLIFYDNAVEWVEPSKLFLTRKKKLSIIIGYEIRSNYFVPI